MGTLSYEVLKNRGVTKYFEFCLTANLSPLGGEFLSLFCIVGLGNPGTQYQQTRHNAGFLVIDAIATRFNTKVSKHGFHGLYAQVTINSQKVLLLKPQTFMNLSGQSVQAAASYYKLDPGQILVIYDDLDLPVGATRVRLSGSSGGHKGLTSIIGHLGNQSMPRIRIGIGKPENNQPVPDYVLTPVSPEQKPLFAESIDRAATAAISFVTEGSTYAMNHFNVNPLPEKLD